MTGLAFAVQTALSLTESVRRMSNKSAFSVFLLEYSYRFPPKLYFVRSLLIGSYVWDSGQHTFELCESAFSSTKENGYLFAVK